MIIHEIKNKKFYIIKDIFVNVSHKTNFISISNVFEIDASGTKLFRN